MSGKLKILKNILFLGSSQGITWTMTVVYTIFVPRYLGPEGLGTLAIGFTLSSIITVIAGMGCRTYLVREVAADSKNASKLVGTTIAVTVGLGALLWALLLVGVNIFVDNPELKTVLLIGAAADLLSLFGNPIQGALQGMEKMQFSLLDSLLGKGLYTLLAIVMAILNMGLIWVALAGLIAGVPAALLNLYYFTRFFKLRFDIRGSSIKGMLSNTKDFFLLDVSLQIYLYLDALMLSIMAGETAVGFYNVPMRLFGTLLFVPVIIGLGILPSLVRLAQQDPENHIKMTRTTLGLFAAVSFPMAAGTTIIANNLIITLYDRSFEPSIPVLILLGWLVIPTYLNIGMAQSFIAEGRQKAWAWINILSIVINFFLNLGFITLAQNMWGNAAIGAAITMLICESITVLIGFKIMTKGIISRNLFFVAIKAMVSTGVMVLVLLPLRGTFFLIPIAVGGAVYAVMALITGLVPYSYQSKALRLPKRLIKREQSV